MFKFRYLALLLVFPWLMANQSCQPYKPPAGGAALVSLGHVSGFIPANPGDPVDFMTVPLTYELLADYGTPVCDLVMRFKLDGDNIGLTAQDGPQHTRVGSDLHEDCSIGSMRINMGGGEVAILVQVACTAEHPIGNDVTIAGMRFASWEGSNPGTYPLTITDSWLRACDEVLLDGATERSHGSITLDY